MDYDEGEQDFKKSVTPIESIELQLHDLLEKTKTKLKSDPTIDTTVLSNELLQDIIEAARS